MDGRREIKVFLVLWTSVALIGASKCPEVRKPHVTSCTIFYNCINLPEGGYVWAPARCSQGLVFQPYLRICVLPGDTWTCDNLESERISLTEATNMPELIDPSQTSYHTYERPSTESVASDPSYGIEGSSDLGNIRPKITPYPLIEIMSNGEKIGSPLSTKQPTGDKTQHEMEKYLFEYFESQHKLRTRLDNVLSNKNEGTGKYTWLRGIVDRILLFENYGSFQSPCEIPAKNHLQKTNQGDYFQNNILHYLVESYILGTRHPMREKSKKRKNDKAVTMQNVRKEEIPVATAEISVVHNNPIDSFVNGPKSENNIVVIEGNLGQREFITINKYKSLSKQIQLRVIDLLPCARGVRLPNSTDCTRYYTCDPDTANIVGFSCPQKTAFNDFNRVCESQRFKICARRLEPHAEQMIVHSSNIETGSVTKAAKLPNQDPCPSTGKFVDSISDTNYYVCFSSIDNPTKIEHLKMTCPNNLIFCQERRVCSTRKRCYDN